jgi:transposase
MSTEGRNLPNDVQQLQALIARQSMALAQRDQLLVQHEAVISRHAVVITEHQALLAQRDAVICQREAVIESQHNVIEKQLQKLAAQEQQLARLLRRQYGPQKERVDPDQLTLFTAEELADLVQQLEAGVVDSVSPDDGSADEQPVADEPAAEKTRTKRKGHGRRPIPDHLPRETVVHDLSDAERLCPCCGRLRAEIGREVSEQLEYIPAQLQVLRHERVRYACRDCQEHVATAPKPPQPIDKGLPGPGLLAHLTLSKYGDYLPLYRLEDILSRSGILLRRSTLCGWIGSVADLLKPLYDLMCRQVLRSRVIHTDDTGIKMLSEGQCQNCKLWAYVGDEANPYVVYEFSLTREGKNPSQFLKDFTGYLQADAFSGYDRVYSRGRVIEVACMAHCRRYWWEAQETDSRRAHEALGYIARLYELETQFEKALVKGDALRAARQQHALPILSAFETWLKQEQANVLPKSPIGQAFTYTLNQWQALCRYTEDGALDIDNNLAERMVKLPAILRKNALFVGSESGGHRAAILLSIFASAKHCGVEPWAWLNAILTELPRRLASAPSTGPPDLSDLLPDAWLKTHPEHRWTIDDLRKVERQRSRQQKSNKRGSQGR